MYITIREKVIDGLYRIVASIMDINATIIKVESTVDADRKDTERERLLSWFLSEVESTVVDIWVDRTIDNYIQYTYLLDN